VVPTGNQNVSEHVTNMLLLKMAMLLLKMAMLLLKMAMLLLKMV